MDWVIMNLHAGGFWNKWNSEMFNPKVVSFIFQVVQVEYYIYVLHDLIIASFGFCYLDTRYILSSYEFLDISWGLQRHSRKTEYRSNGFCIWSSHYWTDHWIISLSIRVLLQETRCVPGIEYFLYAHHPLNKFDVLQNRFS